MAGVTKADLNRIHDRIDKLESRFSEGVTEIKTTVAAVQTTLELNGAPGNSDACKGHKETLNGFNSQQQEMAKNLEKIAERISDLEVTRSSLKAYIAGIATVAAFAGTVVGFTLKALVAYAKGEIR